MNVLKTYIVLIITTFFVPAVNALRYAQAQTEMIESPITRRESRGQSYCSVEGENGKRLRYTYPKKLDSAISCEIKGTKLPCKDRLKVKRTDCGNNRVLNIAVRISYTICNAEDSEHGTVDKIVAKYKGAIVKNSTTTMNYSDDIHAKVKGELVTTSKDDTNPMVCMTWYIDRDVDLCSAGASAQLTYTTENKYNQYCNSYAFYQVKKEWLPSENCNTRTSVTCMILSGDRKGQPCSGNIIRKKSNTCEDINVEYKWEVCNFFVPESGFDDKSVDYQYKFNTKRAKKTYIRFENQDIPFDYNPLPVSERCRSMVRQKTINTCSERRTAASFKISGRLEGAGTSEQCGSFSFLSVKSIRQRYCGFIITEIADPKDEPLHRFIQIYATNKECHGETVNEEQYLAIYKFSKQKVDLSNPIPLNGVTVGKDGFVMFCSSIEGKNYYGKNNTFRNKDKCDDVVGKFTAGDTSGNNAIAILIGDLYKNPVVSDLYGVIGSPGRNTDRDFKDGRVIRNCSVGDLNNIRPNEGKYSNEQFTVQLHRNSADMTPRFWYNKVTNDTLGDVCTSIGEMAQMPPTTSPTISPRKKQKGEEGKTRRNLRVRVE